MSQENVNLQNQRNKIKQKIMDKYNVSSQEAEKILLQIEKKEANKIQKTQNHSNNSKRKRHNINYSSKPISPHKNLDGNYNHLKNNLINQNVNVNFNKKLSNDKHTVETKSVNKFQSFKTEKREVSINNDLKISENSKNVDSILGDLIPNYNQQISVKVDHVDLTFEVSNEKIDTLKESFIRTIKRDKSKKIKIHALKDVSFQIFKGEKVGIIGYNGAGKSTLLNVITGIYPPDKGSVTTYGNISPLLSLGAGFDMNFSGRKNIILNGAVLGYDKEFLESKVDEIIEFSELGEFIDIPIKNYSSGMLAKLGFSIATAVDPDILIIDEVLGVGDVNFAKKSRDKMKSLMDGGTTVLLVSHSIPQIREICDKAIWMDNGSVRAIGEVNKVCDEYLKDAEKASNEQLANIQFR